MWKIDQVEFRKAYGWSQSPFRQLVLRVCAGALLVSACGGEGPREVVETAYRLVSEGEIREATEVVMLDNRSERAQDAAAADMDSILTMGSIDEFHVISEEIDGAIATVIFHFRKVNGEEKLEAREVRRIDGSWTMVLGNRPFSPAKSMAHAVWRVVKAEKHYRDEHGAYTHDVRELTQVGNPMRDEPDQVPLELDPRVALHIGPGDATGGTDSYVITATWRNAPDSFACLYDEDDEDPFPWVTCNGKPMDSPW